MTTTLVLQLPRCNCRGTTINHGPHPPRQDYRLRQIPRTGAPEREPPDPNGPADNLL